jgi:hypothetical protein
MRLEFCYWLRTDRQLLPLMLFTDEAAFTRYGINNTRNSHRQSHDNLNGSGNKFSASIFPSVCGTV